MRAEILTLTVIAVAVGGAGVTLAAVEVLARGATDAAAWVAAGTGWAAMVLSAGAGVELARRGL